jgi:hypothetical protein
VPDYFLSRSRSDAASKLRPAGFFTRFGIWPFFAAYFPGHGFGPIPAPGSFAASAFAVPSPTGNDSGGFLVLALPATLR